MEIRRETLFSPCRTYRYSLWREWDMFNRMFVVFIGLNPSTADESKDDPTIRRCIGFAKEWGFGALCMLNLFAFRATDPKDMMSAGDPIGPENDGILRSICRESGKIIAAWGVHGSFLGRDKEVSKLIPMMWCLGTTKDGFPRHPLYVKKDQKLELWSAPDAFKRAIFQI
jgi:hypothetical protein